nr:ufm1 conjugating enzyme [Hymenolepis microstoma]
MASDGLKKTLAAIPLCKTRAGPRDGDDWVKRLKEEYMSIIKYVEHNKANDNHWFQIESNSSGTRWSGKCWYIHEMKKYEFDVCFDIPVSYPASNPEIALPELDGKTAKMYRGGKICLTDHFKPLWARNVPKFGIAHALALGLGPWLAVEIPDLVDWNSLLMAFLESIKAFVQGCIIHEVHAMMNFLEFIVPTLSAVLIGSSGIFPAFFIESPDKLNLNEKVFFHLLPETVEQFPIQCHKWAFFILFGIFFFYGTECVVTFYESLKTVGYLNLLANSIDNFSHGLSVGAGYAVSIRAGLVATICLLIHEIPHEISDFIILLRSGFTKWDAIKGQLCTASTCLIGTFAIAIFKCSFKDYMLLLPFTAGGFLYIAMVSLLPTFLKEKDKTESFIQTGCILLGVGCIQGITRLHL